jgi:hypothetical protein
MAGAELIVGAAGAIMTKCAFVAGASCAVTNTIVNNSSSIGTWVWKKHGCGKIRIVFMNSSTDKKYRYNLFNYFHTISQTNKFKNGFEFASGSIGEYHNVTFIVTQQQVKHANSEGGDDESKDDGPPQTKSVTKSLMVPLCDFYVKDQNDNFVFVHPLIGQTGDIIGFDFWSNVWFGRNKYSKMISLTAFINYTKQTGTRQVIQKQPFRAPTAPANTTSGAAARAGGGESELAPFLKQRSD